MDAERPPALEPPGVPTGRVLMAGAGLLGLLAFALTAMALQFLLLVGQAPRPTTRAFPEPRLETSIDPRRRAAARPGPVSPPPATPSLNAERALQAAMAAVAARGAHAYDPVPPGPGSER